MIIYGEPVVRYVAIRVGTDFVPPYEAIGREKNGLVVAGGVFNCFTGPDVELTAAAERGMLSRALLNAWRGYAFDKLGCCRVSFTTERPNVVTVLQKLGAVIEGTKRNAFGDGRDATMLGLLKKDWALQ